MTAQPSAPNVNRTIWPWVAGIVALLVAVGWWVQPEKAIVPKPLGQVRLTLPDTATATYTSSCGTSFRLPRHAKVELRNTPAQEQGCWYNLAFPRFQARIHCTERAVGTDLNQLMKDAQSLVFGHESAATGIRRQSFELPGKFGMIFLLEGPVATPMQFYITDSTQHFMRGSLYFNHRPNPDSTAPVLDRMEADVRKLMETLKWS
tara:strand:+ start:12123 stop:12737 length:615 start_codon:yes stop_codon:yes gene_type:complete